MSALTFSIEITADNAELIARINNLVLESIGFTPSKTEKPKTETSKTEKPKTETSKTEKETEGPSAFTVFQNAAELARKEHSTAFLKEILKEFSVPMKQSINKTISAVKPDLYSKIIERLEAGPVENDNDDGFDDDGFDDDEADTPNVDPEAVRAALKSYSKTESRAKAVEIMKKHGVKSISNLADGSQEALAAILKEVA